MPPPQSLAREGASAAARSPLAAASAVAACAAGGLGLLRAPLGSKAAGPNDELCRKFLGLLLGLAVPPRHTALWHAAVLGVLGGAAGGGAEGGGAEGGGAEGGGGEAAGKPAAKRRRKEQGAAAGSGGEQRRGVFGLIAEPLEPLPGAPPFQLRPE
jgi:hypothetical protein